MATVREQTLFANTLVCLVKSLEGMVTTLELRNESSVTGTIEHVDRMMNTTLTDATFTTITGTTTAFESFYIQGKNVRFVHIPDEVDIMQAIKSQLGMFHKRRTHTEGNKKQPGKKSRMKEVLMRKMERMQAALERAQKDTAEAGKQGQKDNTHAEKRVQKDSTEAGKREKGAGD